MTAATYPNVLALEYLAATGRSTREATERGIEFLRAAYQRYLVYEAPGGGLTWFGSDEPDLFLTARGLPLLLAMSKWIEVDPAVIERTRSWVLQQQASDGGWNYGGHHWVASAMNRSQMTAYCLRSLAMAGETGEPLRSAAGRLEADLAGEAIRQADAYALALALDGLSRLDEETPLETRVRETLLARVETKGGLAHWPDPGRGFTGSFGPSAEVEATALAVSALLRRGEAAGLVSEAARYLLAHRGPTGAWSTTMGTILALEALLDLSKKSAAAHLEEPVTISLSANGGAPVELHIAPEDADVVLRADLTPALAGGRNRVEIVWPGGKALPFTWQVVLSGYEKKPERSAPGPEGGLSLVRSFAGGAEKVAAGRIATMSLRVANGRDEATGMIVVEVPLAPGLEADRALIERMVGTGPLARAEFEDQKVVLYLTSLPARGVWEFNLPFVPRHPAKVELPSAWAYEFYRPENEATAPPVALEVGG
ncbi:MAG: hypothetical protein HY720_27725 [Planctomycetes bacterium]|nr:hypothetical protein [Planctomycetota bacterium]